MEEAEYWLNHALEIDPEYSDAFTNRGIIYHRRKQMDRAIQNATEALRWKTGEGLLRRRRFASENDGCEVAAPTILRRINEGPIVTNEIPDWLNATLAADATGIVRNLDRGSPRPLSVLVGCPDRGRGLSGAIAAQ